MTQAQQPMDWQPYLAKVDAILEKKGQPKLTQNESQNLANNWQNMFMTEGALLMQLPPAVARMMTPNLVKSLANCTYDVLKASRGDNFK